MLRLSKVPRGRGVAAGAGAGVWVCALMVMMSGCTGARFEGEKTARVELTPGMAAAPAPGRDAPGPGRVGEVNARPGEAPSVSAYVDLESALGSSQGPAVSTPASPDAGRWRGNVGAGVGGDRPVVRIVSQGGWVSVKPGAVGAVDAVGYVRATTAERYETADVVAVRESDGSVTVRLDWPGTANVGETAGLEVTVPAEADVDVRTPEGRLSVAGLRGELFLRTGDGDIEVVEHRGPVRAETGSGRVDVVEVTGPVVVRSGSGDVTVVMAPAPAPAPGTPGSGAPGSAGDGAWQIAGADAKPRAAGSPGAGNPGAGLPGVVDIDTGRGTVRLTLTRDFAQELELGTGSGVIDVRDLPAARIIATGQRYMHVAIGEGAGKSRAVTGRGNVVVRVGE